MDKDTKKRLDQINIENNIWIIYIGIIVLSFYSNYLEKNYFMYKDINCKNLYRKINTIIFIVLVVVYSYFENDALDSFFNKNSSSYNNRYSLLVLVATTLVLISGIIFLFIVIDDIDLETEIAFN